MIIGPTFTESMAEARIRLICPYVHQHTLGAVLRVFDPTGEVWPVGLQPNGIHWSDGVGNLIQQSWGTAGGQLIVRANASDQQPISIEGQCKRCARARGAAASARPGLKWYAVIELLDTVVADGIRDTALQMSW